MPLQNVAGCLRGDLATQVGQCADDRILTQPESLAKQNEASSSGSIRGPAW